MFTRRFAFLVPILIVSLWVFLGARAPEPGLSGSRTRVGLSSDIARGGGGVVGWDTVTVVFATNVDTNHFYQQHDNDINNATYVVDLDTVDTFAHGLLDSALSTAGYYHTRLQPLEGAPRQLINGNSRLDHRLGDGYGDKTMPIFHIPFEDFIPKNAHIVSADVSVYNYSSLYFAVGDTIMTTLMNAPADSAWYRNKGISTSPNYAHATWNQQRATTVGGQATGAADVKYWDPPISDRAYYWDMGVDMDWIGDWSGSFYATPGTGGDGYSFSIRNCVQGAVNGETNNGISVFFAQDDPTLARGASFFHWDEDGTSANKSPWVTVKYITKKYVPPFGSAEWAFVFSTDDAQPANSAYTDSFLAHDMRYTLFQSLIQIGSLGRMDMDSITVWHGEGFEYGPHTRGHPVDGVLKWQPADTSAADMDSLYYALAMSWVDSLGQAFDGTSRSADPYWAKSMALANNRWGPEALLAIANIGYEAMRSGGIDGYSDKAYYELATQGAARTDSIMAGITHHDGRRPRNMVGLPLTVGIQELVGAKADVGVTEAEILQNFKRLVYQVRGDGRGVINTFAHDFKTDPNAASYQEGLDVDECGWMLDAVGALGGRSMRVSEYARWIKSGATPVPTPDAYSQVDTFKFAASDRVWFVPNGIDNTPIRGVRPDAATYSYDTTAPTAPSDLLAIAGDGQVVLSWTGATDKSTVTYNVYRFFDGSADTTLIASKVYNTFYSDTGAMNGTEHFYFVSASDLAENESYDSGVASDTPLGTLSLITPAYYALWYQNPPATSPTAAQYDSLAAFDVVVAGALSLNGDASEPFYAGMKDSLVARNSDIVVLSYAMAITPRTDWGSYPAGSAQKRTWDFLSAVADSNGFGKNTSGVVVRSNAYPTFFTNIMTAAYADTIARYWVDALNGSGMDGAHSGFFVDLADSSLADWICNVGGPCTSLMDFDQDATAYGSDADEKAAYKAFQLAFTKALRREFAENGMADRLIVHNGDYARNNASVAKYVDGFMWEGWNVYVPGAQGSEAVWETTIAKRDLLVNAQTNPPLVLYNARADSNYAFITEPLSLAYGGLTGVQNTGDGSGNYAIPAMVRRLPNPGAISSYDAANDTLVVTAANYTARLDINHTAADSFTVWPYFIVSGTDTLSRGGGWPRQPPAPEIEYSYAGDGTIEFSWNDDQLYGIPAYDLTEVYRSTSDDTTTLELFDYHKQIGEYWNTSVTNDSTYYYALKNADFFGSESAFSEVIGLTPSAGNLDISQFSIAATVPSDTTAAGNVRPNVTISYSGGTPFVKPMFRRHDGTYADWADTSSTFWLNPAAADWSGLYDTGVPIATAAEDSGGIDITWDAGTGQTGYLLQMSANGGAWVTVDGSISSGSTSFTHAASDSPPPERGELRYRLYGYNGDPDTTAVATHDSLFYNQAVRVYGKFLALSDTSAAHAGIVETSEQSVLYISYPPPGAPDTTPPDTTGVFAAVAFDTTDTDNVVVTTTGTASENVQVWLQWKNGSAGTWTPAERWQPMSYAAAISDSIGTLDSTATLDGDTVYVRVKMRDTSENESAFIGANDGNWIAKVFARAVPAADDTVGYGTIGSSSSSIGGSAAYGVRIVADANGSCVSGSVYLTVGGATYSVKAALYDASFNLLANGTLAKSGDGANGWHTVTFSAPTAITSGTPYILMFQADTAGISAYYDTEGAAANNIAFVDTPGYASFPDDPMTPVAQYNNRRYSAYVTFE